MDKKTLPWLLVSILVILAVAIMFPAGKNTQTPPTLPWDITIDSDGNTKVFNLTLSQSTLSDAQKEFSKAAEISMFASPQGDYTVEAYFERLYISGIRADLILTLNIDQQTTAQMFERGLRLSQLGSGEKKITLDRADHSSVVEATISHITYLPAANLDAELIQSRFGSPAKRHTEPSGIVHWLYPDKGLDVALNPEGKEVLQYTSPIHFNRILKPLMLNDQEKESSPQ